jgi:hypothetical protein
MRTPPAPSRGAPRPELHGQDGTDQDDEESGHDHDQPEDHGQMLMSRIEPAQA